MSEPALYGHDLFGEVVRPPSRGMIADEFLVPPFSVLNAREGFWQDRKRAWIDLGIKSELGRGAPPGGSPLPAADYSKGERGDGRGRPIEKDLTWTGAAKSIDFYRVKEGMRDDSQEQGSSIFDPVVCELAYRWFSPVGGDGS